MLETIQKRIVNTKRHTKAYVVDGRRITRGKVVKLARRGHFKYVVAKRGPTGWYISSTPSTSKNLYSLPIVIE